MPDQWEEAAKAFKPAATGAPATAPANEDWKLWSAKSADEKPGFMSSLGETLKKGPGNLLAAGNAINGFVAHPSTILPAINRMGQQTVDMGSDAVRSFKKGDVIGGVRKGINTGINAVAPGLGAQSEDAGQEFDKGNTAAGFGKTLGVGVNTALGLKAPAITRGAGTAVYNTPRALGTVGPFVKAAAPDAATGGALVAGGELLSKVPGMEYPARIGMGLPGATLIGRGIKSGIGAAREAWNPAPPAVVEPTASAPFEPFRPNPRTAARMPFGGSAEPTYSPASPSQASGAYQSFRDKMLGPSEPVPVEQPKPFEPFRPNPRIAARIKGGPISSADLPDTSSSRPTAPGLSSGASGPTMRKVEVQHLGDMRLPRNQAKPIPGPKMYDAAGRLIQR